jgi:hypothetical protein
VTTSKSAPADAHRRYIVPTMTALQYKLLLDIFKWAKNEKMQDEYIVILIDDLRSYIESGVMTV